MNPASESNPRTIDTSALPRQRTDETESVVSRWHAVGREVPE